MNPQELFTSDGKSAGVWFCAKCKHVHGMLVVAERCCDPKCTECGAPCEQQYYTMCSTCLSANRAKRERERFDKAEKIPESSWTGGVFLGETFYPSVSELRDYDGDDSINLSEVRYVWAAVPERFVFLEVDRLIENILEEGYEGFDSDDVKGVVELEKAIDAFNEANKCAVAYWESNTKAIILEAKE